MGVGTIYHLRREKRSFEPSAAATNAKIFDTSPEKYRVRFDNLRIFGFGRRYHATKEVGCEKKRLFGENAF